LGVAVADGDRSAIDEAGVSFHNFEPIDDACLLADVIRNRPAGPIAVRQAVLAAPFEVAFPVLCRHLGGDLIGTVSPMPIAIDLAPEPVPYAVHPATAALPPTVGTPCPDLCVMSAEAVAALGPSVPAPAGTIAQYLDALAARLVELGFGHVAAPGLALGWSPSSLLRSDSPEWWRRYVRELDSSANVSLDSHRLWAETRLRPMRVVLDGACITRDTHTGTQRVVVELSRALVATRPSAEVSLAVHRDVLPATAAKLSATGVRVVRRDRAGGMYDVIYRPYQMLRATELAWCLDAAPRLAVGQLDMIGFRNPSYHPSPEAFFLARNLQRTMMREADALTFISEFGLRAATSEVPDVSSARTFVVSCGVDVTPADERRPDGVPDGPFVAMVSATFSHKNRPHAIKSFSQLCAVHGFDGHLVIAGPEPFYGRSESVERALLDQLPRDVVRRVVRLGLVSEEEKWWVMRHAAVVLYPSTVEGFGLVPFEAAAVGVPSLSYEGTALGEILGQGAATVDTWSVDTWAERLHRLLTDKGASTAAIAHVQSAAARHTWWACAELTWDALDAAVALPTAAPTAEEGPLVSRVAPTTRRTARTLAARATALRLWHGARRRVLPR
jgi:glycosyltransferase involved in cell wall biosynthesis